MYNKKIYLKKRIMYINIIWIEHLKEIKFKHLKVFFVLNEFFS